MLKRILAVLLLAAMTLVGLIASRPAEFSVQRDLSVAARPVVVYAQVHDPSAWRAWSPWETVDPQMQRSYSGPPAGVGAVYAWRGNKDVGAGRMTIVEAKPYSYLRFKLEFFEPYTATHDAEFFFEASGTGTRVTWRMSGRKDFLGKAVGMVMDMDRMIGSQFDQGLLNLKRVAEIAQKEKK